MQAAKIRSNFISPTTNSNTFGNCWWAAAVLTKVKHQRTNFEYLAFSTKARLSWKSAQGEGYATSNSRCTPRKAVTLQSLDSHYSQWQSLKSLLVATVTKSHSSHRTVTSQSCAVTRQSFAVNAPKLAKIRANNIHKKYFMSYAFSLGPKLKIFNGLRFFFES